MRIAGALVIFACAIGPGVFWHGAAQAQNVPVPRPVNPARVADPLWRQNLTGFMNRPPANPTVRDVEQLQGYLLAAMPYCTGLSPNDYEANRALVRNMTAYLVAMNAAARDPETRAAIAQVNQSIAVFPCAVPNGQTQPQPGKQAAAPAPAAPPFALQAPEIENIAAADKDTARELRQRYETDAANAAATWTNAEAMRLNLAKQGMALNVQTATSLGRFQLFFEQAEAALKDRHWDDARSSLEAVEGETQKVAKVVGR
jgi:hypothetical protein